MTDSHRETVFDCETARRAIHRGLDAEPIDADVRQRLRAHLSGCAACREIGEELRSIQAALRALPVRPLSDEALEEVWTRTSRASRRWSLDWRIAAAAAAAAVMLALLALWPQDGPGPATPSDEELRVAARQTRMVLKFTAQALRKTERVAIRDVLVNEVSGALLLAPIEWPRTPADERRRSGT